MASVAARDRFALIMQNQDAFAEMQVSCVGSLCCPFEADSDLSSCCSVASRGWTALCAQVQLKWIRCRCLLSLVCLLQHDEARPDLMNQVFDQMQVCLERTLSRASGNVSSDLALSNFIEDMAALPTTEGYGACN